MNELVSDLESAAYICGLPLSKGVYLRHTQRERETDLPATWYQPGGTERERERERKERERKGKRREKIIFVGEESFFFCGSSNCASLC